MIRKRRFSATFDYDTRWGFKSEIDLFAHIWDNRFHNSYLSGQPIQNPTPENFAHVLAKGLNKYPHFRLNPDNVILVTEQEHHIIDAGTKADRDKINADWEAFDRLKETLMKQYGELY